MRSGPRPRRLDSIIGIAPSAAIAPRPLAILDLFLWREASGRCAAEQPVSRLRVALSAGRADFRCEPVHSALAEGPDMLLGRRRRAAKPIMKDAEKLEDDKTPLRGRFPLHLLVISFGLFVFAIMVLMLAL